VMSTASTSVWWERPERGLPVGAVVVLRPSRVNAVKSALAQVGWLKAGLCVTRDAAHGDGALAVHVSHCGAAALGDALARRAHNHGPAHRQDDDSSRPLPSQSSSAKENDPPHLGNESARESVRTPIPHDIVAALDSGDAVWVPGLRARSQRCRHRVNRHDDVTKVSAADARPAEPAAASAPDSCAEPHARGARVASMASPLSAPTSTPHTPQAEDVEAAAGHFSDADLLVGAWSRRDALASTMGSVCCRGVIHANTARAASGWRPLRRPQSLSVDREVS